MVIYGEYLFLENFIVGLVILFFTGKIAGEKMSKIRIAIGGVLCGIYSFLIFVDMGGLVSLICKIAFTVVVVLITFRRKNLKKIVVDVLLFLIITFLYGGIAIALITTFSWNGIREQPGVYLPGLTYLSVSAAAIAAALGIMLTIQLVKEKRNEKRSLIELIISVDGREWHLNGYVDTGNFLKDPLTNKPVSIASTSLMEEIVEKIKMPSARYTLIPYNSIGVKNGILVGFRLDYMKAQGKTIEKPVLAAYENINLGEKKTLLLNCELLERGINGDFK